MADPVPLDPARERILKLSREIDELARQTMPVPQFLREFLSRLVLAAGSLGGAVWLREGNRILPVAEHRLAEIGLPRNAKAVEQNQQLLGLVLGNAQAVIAAPDDPARPWDLDCMTVMAPLQCGKETIGAVQLFQPSDTPAAARAGLLQYLEQMAGIATRFLSRPDKATSLAEPDPAVANAAPPATAGAGASAAFWAAFEPFVLQLQRSLSVREVAALAVNDARGLIGCDRVSLAVKEGRRSVLRAISGQDTINPRANLVAKLTKLVSIVLAAEEPLIYGRGSVPLAPQVEVALTAYLEESGARQIIILPLFSSEPVARTDDPRPRRRTTERRLIGGLVIEQIVAAPHEAGDWDRIQRIADHIAAALANARQHEAVFLLPLWRTLGRTWAWFRGRRIAAALAILTGVAAVVTGLVLIPAEYEVPAEGRLMPVVQRNVFAPWDGDVVEILVRSGERVAAGQPLVRLRNDDLRSELLRLRNTLDQQRQLLDALQAERNSLPAGKSVEEDVRLQGRIVETLGEIQGGEVQLKILEDRHARLLCTAPLAGVVATFQLDQLLRDRPVKRGDILLEVMDDQGPWHLELQVEEHRMGHLFEGRRIAPDAVPPVKFVLATDTETTFHGRLATIATRANAVQARGSLVDLVATLDAGQPLPPLRIGAEARAKIACGQKPLGYLLFGDVIEFCQLGLWRWL